MSRTLAAVLCALLAVICMGAGAGARFIPEVDPQQAGSVKVVIVSKQDDTGKWVNEVKLEHGTEQAPWKVEVEQKMLDRGGRPSVELTATLTGPSNSVPHTAAVKQRLAESDESADDDFNMASNERKVDKTETEYNIHTQFPVQSNYKIHTKQMDWKTANKTCAEEGAHLAVINSEEEARFLATTLRGYHDAYRGAFVGITDEAEEGKWLTIFGESIEKAGFARWFRSDQPDNANGKENCGALFPDNGGFNDVPCTEYLMHSICEKDQASQITAGLPELSNMYLDLSSSENYEWESNEFVTDEPESEYTPVSGSSSYYKVLKTQMDWETANKTCIEEAAHLAIINSEEEAMLLVKMLGRYAGTEEGAFVGITDKDEEGAWVTVLDESLAEAGFARWVLVDGSANPDNIENCGAIMPGTGSYHDVPCTGYLMHSICEKDNDKASEESTRPSNSVTLPYLAAVKKRLAESDESAEDDFNMASNDREVDKTEPKDDINYPVIGSYYRLLTTQMDWKTANKTCAEEGAHLAVINSAFEAGFLATTIHRYFDAPRGAFVGITDEAEEGKWLTIFGESIENAGFARWFRGDQPDNANGNENCGALFPANGGFNDVPCTEYLMHSICEIEKRRGKSTRIPELYNMYLDLSSSENYLWESNKSVTDEPESEYAHVSGSSSYYKVLTTQMDWETANKTCTEEGAHLAIINSEEEAMLLVKMLGRYAGTKEGAFAGITDKDEEGTWVTVMDESLAEAGFARWVLVDGSANPDNIENSGAIMPGTGSYHDVPCTGYLMHSICEKDEKDEKAEKDAKDESEFKIELLTEMPDEEPSSSTEIPKSDPIAMGYEQHPVLSYYKLHARADKDWNEALKTCKAEGGSLASIDSIDEFEFLKSMLVRPPLYGKSKAFIGIDNLVDGLSGHHDDDDYNYDEFVNSEKCGAIHVSQESVEIVACQNHIPFICEISQDRSEAEEVQVVDVEENEEMGNAVDPLVFLTSPRENDRVHLMAFMRYMSTNRGHAFDTAILNSLQNGLLDDELAGNE